MDSSSPQLAQTGRQFMAFTLLASSMAIAHAADYVVCNDDGHSFHLAVAVGTGNGGTISFFRPDRRLVWKAPHRKGVIQQIDVASLTYSFDAGRQRGAAVIKTRRGTELRVEGVELERFADFLRALSQ